jgi:hypothetical protein
MTKDEALKLALEAFERMNHKDSIYAGEFDNEVNAIKEALAQPEPNYKKALEVWLDKTEWVQETAKPHELGMHRADVLKQRIQEASPQRTWEPVETAPKDGTDVLLMYMHIDTQVVHNGFWIGASDADDESEIGWWSYDYSEVTRIKLDDWMNPTHWLPLPKLKEKNS